jgi:hypothetical protein
MNCRNALQALTAAGSLALAGCSSLAGVGESGTVLGRIEVINASYVSNRIRLLVVRDDETGTRATVIEPTWEATPGQYSIHAHHIEESGDRESSSWEYTLTRQEYDRYYTPGHNSVNLTVA